MSTEHTLEDDILDRLGKAGFLNLYSTSADEALREMTEDQHTAYVTAINNPHLKAYLQRLAANIVQDLLRLKFERPDEQIKLAARYARGSGALEVIDQLIRLGV